MINITNKIARRRYHAEMTRQMVRLENIYAKRLKPILNRQYLNTAKLVRQGILDGVDHAVNKERERLEIQLWNQYHRTGTVFSKKTFRIFEDSKIKGLVVPETKGPENEFWAELNRWANTTAAQQITKVQKTTKKVLANVIYHGMAEGESHREIAKRIVRTGRIATPYRARVIAATETHTGAVKSVDVAVASTRVEMEKEWLATMDKRTRDTHADVDGDRIAQDAVFIVDGMPMEYPGDPAGGADNTVLCRCVLMYHTVRRSEPMKPYEPEEGFLPTSTIQEAEERFKSLGINNIGQLGGKYGWETEKSFIDNALNPTLEELERLKIKFPYLTKQLNKEKIQGIDFFKGRGLKKSIKRGFLGEYDTRFNRIKLAIPDLTERLSPSLFIGKRKFLVSRDFKTTLRHELSHHLENIPNISKRFTKFWNKKATFDGIEYQHLAKEWFENNVSIYSASNKNEALAECFTAITSPLYKRRMLPKELEEVFEKLLGKIK